MLWYRALDGSDDPGADRAWQFSARELDGLKVVQKGSGDWSDRTVAATATSKLDSLSRSSYRNLATGVCWTIEADLALIRLINRCAAKRGVRFTNLRFEDVQLDSEASSPGSVLSGINADAIRARAAALMLLNIKLSSCLTLMEVGGQGAWHWLVSLRGLILRDVKLGVWKSMLDATETPVAAAAEDFEVRIESSHISDCAKRVGEMWTRRMIVHPLLE